MNRVLQILVLLIICSIGFASDGDVPPHLVQARLIANDIDASHNAYAHKNCFIQWKGVDGATYFENRTDCSDFLDLLLEHTYHFTPQQMRGWTGHERPFATTWYDTIHNGNGFEILTNVQSIRPGDVIAIKFPPGLADTGHIMIAASEPRPHVQTAPLHPGASQWELDIIDSSKSGHGKKDTRSRADGTFSQGVGEGTIRLYSNNDGNIVGYSWSVLAGSAFESAAERKVAVGRLKSPSSQ